MAFWSRKSVEQLTADCNDAEGKPRLHRSLGVVDLTAFGIGNTVGAGIFVLTGSVAALHAGPGVTLSFIIASIACFLAGLCYAEFAAMVPVAGSAYSYAYTSIGEGLAWLMGWCLMFEYIFSASLVAIGWSGYLVSALADLGIHWPAALATAPINGTTLSDIHGTGTWFNLPAVLVICACTVLLLFSARQSSIVNAVIVASKLVAIGILVFIGAHYVDPANWHPFIPPNTGTSGEFGWSGIMMGAGIVFFSYIGFDGVSTLAEETRNPQRTMPLSLFLSLGICALLYVGVSMTITGMTSYTNLNVPDPLYKALQMANASLPSLKALVAVVAIIGMLSVILLSLLGQIRIFYAMGRDGLLPQVLSRTSRRFRTPYIGTLVTGFFAALTAALVPLDLLSDLISSGTLLVFALVCVCIPILRRTNPQAHRPFRTPWVPVIPILGAVSCVGLMFSLSGDTWIRLAIWLVLGVLVYLAYGRRHSRLRNSA
ncbi:MAG: amino acid permease [Steroidobacteraceae bacterium]